MMRRWEDLWGGKYRAYFRGYGPYVPPKSLNKKKKKGKTSGVFGSMWILLHHWPAQV